MKAVVYEKYGEPDVLHLKELPRPVPGDNQILVRVQATSVCAGDIKVRSFKNIPPLYILPYRLYLGLFKPKRQVLGMELAGEVESIGRAVKKYKPGDCVFGLSPLDSWGAYARYICLPEEGMTALMPSNMSFEEAAAVPYMGLSALYYLKKLNLRSGSHILINGASGSLGSYAVQLAKYLGAEVTGVCSHVNLELVKSLGADDVIDYEQEDFSNNGKSYDFIFDAVAKSSFRRCKGALKPKGIYLSSLPSLILLIQMLLTAMGGGRKALYLDALPSMEDLLYLRTLIEKGILRAVIDRCYSLEQIVEAHRYVDGGHKKGNVVIKIDQAAP